MNVIKSFIASEAVIKPYSVFRVRENACSVTTGTVVAIRANIGGFTRNGFSCLVDDMMGGEGIGRNVFYFPYYVFGNGCTEIVFIHEKSVLSFD